MIEISPGDIKRDRWGRPVLGGVPYTRPSTLAKALDDGAGLIKWGARQTALGLAKSPDLIALAATCSEADTQDLNGIVDQAQSRAQTASAANLGTAVHQATYAHDRGEDISQYPEGLEQQVERYSDLLAAHDIVPIVGELFVVNERLQCAGTLDRLLTGPNATVVGDIKTSKSSAPRYSGVSWKIQVAVYAESQPVVDGKVRTWDEVGLPTPSQKHGVVLHLPNDQSEAHLLVADLAEGRALADLALSVRQARKQNDLPRLEA